MNHSRDYLIEYSNTKVKENWLKSLICNSILYNGAIPQNILDSIYKSLRYGTPVAVPSVPETSPHTSGNLKFESLKHISGVCALRVNQIIKFSNDITILYGLNGAGKSSYFKILNEVVGGNQRKEILHNIYSEVEVPFSVEMKYKVGPNQYIKSWNNTERAYSDLLETKVFDSSYLGSFLDKHVVDQSVVLPYGLHLFSYIIEQMDEFKRKIGDEIKDIQKPEIDTSKLTDNLKKEFLEGVLSEQTIEKLKDISLFSEDEKSKKVEITKKIQEVNSVNIDDKIKLYSSRVTEFVRLKEKIENWQKKINDCLKKTMEIIPKRKNAEKKVEDAKIKIEILKDITGNDSPEWKSFIQSGLTYSNKFGLDGKTCPYCHQPILLNAESLIKAYSDYIKDESQCQLQDLMDEFQNLEQSIRFVKFDCEISSVLNDDPKDIILTDSIKQVIEELQKISKQIVEMLKNVSMTEQIDLLDYSTLIQNITERKKFYEDQSVELNRQKINRQEILKPLETAVSFLLEKEAVVLQKNKIEDYIQKQNLRNELNKIASTIKTKSLSTLAGNAYQALVSNNLFQNFSQYLSDLQKYSGLEVRLKTTDVNKGIAKTQLILTNGEGIGKILSEGEQKTVGLALFLAEIKTQQCSSPIIFDDPVTSLDHKIASNFANLLMTLNNQIIIFTHSRLFLDTFECTKENHVCKTIDSACNATKGKHIKIYSVQSEGLNDKGVLISYKGNRAMDHLRNANSNLNEPIFTKAKETASELRQCIECIVDEIVFRNCVPTKFSNKNSRINWEDLKKVGAGENTINKLNSFHSRLSGGDLHEGTESLENPIEKDEFLTMVSELTGIINS